MRVMLDGKELDEMNGFKYLAARCLQKVELAFKSITEKDVVLKV